MPADLSELEADCAELKSMLEKATRATVRQELQRVLAKFEAELKVKRATGETKSSASSADAKAAPAAKQVIETVPAAKPATAPVHTPVPITVKAGPWTEITTFALDLGGYDKPLITVDIRLKGVENLPAENVTCDFTESSLDLKVVGLDGVDYRFLKTNLEKDIAPRDSNVKVKKNHVIITLHKVKGDYGYDSWTDLVAKGKRKPAADKKKDPQESIMGMMQDLYEDGDDNMKQIIGEAMYKAKRGEKYEPKGDDMKMPRLDKMDDI